MTSSLSFNYHIITVLLVLANVINLVGAFKSLAGHCAPGDLSDKASSGHGLDGRGSLANGSMQVKFDAITLNTSSAITLSPNKEYTVTLESSASNFRGFLVRLSGVNGVRADGVLVATSDNNVQSLLSCEPKISGMTHNDAGDKSSVSFSFDYAGSAGVDLLLEVTVVQSRVPNAWYYSAFNLSIADAAPVPSPTVSNPTPVAVPSSSTPAPVVDAFTSAPVASTPTPSESESTSSPTKSSGYKWQLSSWTSAQVVAFGAATIFAVMIF